MEKFIGSRHAFEESNIVVLSVPYEKTVCYMPGASKGPAAIIEASLQLESFDAELGYEIDKKVKIHTAKEVGFGEIEKSVSDVVQKNKLPVLLGGEHSITVPAVKACAKRYRDLSVLQIDAHADLRNEYQGDKNSHACTMRRVREITKRTVQVGIRDMSLEEYEYIEKEKIRDYVHGTEFDTGKVVGQLLDNVYITIYLGGFDPSEVPAVGTPQPGGLHWDEVTGLLRMVSKKKNIVGFDIVELAPIKGQAASDFLAAKLAYRLMGYSTAKSK